MKQTSESGKTTFQTTEYIKHSGWWPIYNREITKCSENILPKCYSAN